MAERKRQVIIFVREPVAGRVKTRLGHDIGMVGAAWWARHRLAALLRAIGQDPRWQVSLAVTPDAAARRASLPGGFPRIAQGPGDLGARMARVFRAAGPGPVLVIGSDIPGIRAAHLADAFARLGQSDAVFGPSPDGGYWLVGLHRGTRPILPGLFRSVRWSGPHALGDTLAPLWGRRVSFVTPMQDVDCAADLPGGPV